MLTAVPRAERLPGARFLSIFSVKVSDWRLVVKRHITFRPPNFFLLTKGLERGLLSFGPRKRGGSVMERTIDVEAFGAAQAFGDGPDRCELTILMPCLNEAETLARCIAKAKAFLASSGVSGEIVVADNGSTDGSQAIARASGARVISVQARGYGNALRSGIEGARGEFVVMGDSDDSYDFGKLELFIEKLREGFELVMGNRFRGGIALGAMPKLHRYLGNPVLTTVGKMLFGSSCGDFHCGLRGMSRNAMRRLDLRASGMEFASEMVVKATLAGLRITEVPTTLSPDGRSRPPHLRSWRDGWRHLRFLLLFSPRWLFFYPGVALFCLGAAGMAWLLPASRTVGGVTLDIHSLYYSSLAVVTGFQAVLFWIFSKIYVVREGFIVPSRRFRAVMNAATLEAGLLGGLALILVGVCMALLAFHSWSVERFGPLSPSDEMRLIIPSGVALLLGMQVMFAGFFASILEVRSGRALTNLSGAEAS